MLRKVIEIQKEEAMERHSAPNAPVAPVSVTMDAGDKFIRAAGNGLARSIGMEEDKVDADFGAVYLPATEMIRRCAMHDGQREAENWGPMELAHYALRRMSYSRDAGANVAATSSTGRPATVRSRSRYRLTAATPSSGLSRSTTAGSPPIIKQ